MNNQNKDCLQSVSIKRLMICDMHFEAQYLQFSQEEMGPQVAQVWNVSICKLVMQQMEYTNLYETSTK